jgi:hypothetical protein
MGRRTQPYSRVLQGARKPEARTKYLAFLAGTATRADKIGTRGKRPPSIKLAVVPFGLALPATVEQECSASKVAVVAFQTSDDIKSRVKQRIASGAQAGVTLTITGTTIDTVKDVRVTPARVIRKIYDTDTAVAKTSETTGLRYGYKKSTSLSMPFGSKGATDKESDAFAAIAADLLASSPKPELTAINLVSEVI